MSYYDWVRIFNLKYLIKIKKDKMILKKKLEKYRNLPFTRTFPETRTELRKKWSLGICLSKKNAEKKILWQSRHKGPWSVDRELKVDEYLKLKLYFSFFLDLLKIAKYNEESKKSKSKLFFLGWVIFSHSRS